MSKSSSLFALYRRGRRYRDLGTSAENPEVEKSREERERFIAASLALCLRCDLGFRERFWLNVCRVSDDPNSPPPIRPEDILLEPPHWADLRLISDSPSGRYIWVVEIKTGGSLKEKQNPSLPDFEQEGLGYGWLLHRHESAHRRMRYIILGAAESFTLPPQHGRFPIWLRRANWEDVYRCRTARTENHANALPLVDDLFACLAAFQLDPFIMETAKSIHVASGLAGVGNARTVLEAVCQFTGAKFREKNLSMFSQDSGTIFGLYVAREGAPAASIANFHSVCDSDQFPAWIGYIADANDDVTRSCWLMFNAVEKRDSVMALLRQRFPLAGPNEDDYRKPAIEVNSSPSDGINDFDWFRSVLESAAASAT